MRFFRDTYVDQTIIPEEQVKLSYKLDSLVRTTSQDNFSRVHTLIMKALVTEEDTTIQHLNAIMTFDSIALFSEEIKPGMFSPLSLELICKTYQNFNDRSLDKDDLNQIKDVIREMERFQLRDEFAGVVSMLRRQPEFSEFDRSEQFTEDAAYVIREMRHPEFDFYKIKPTLRSFILLWNDQRSAPDFEQFDLLPLYEFIRYMRAVIEQSKD
jgi:hypothetical protein